MGQDFVLSDFIRELNDRQSRVEEFQYIKSVANELGIKHVYMFGGTAAAWGHYVRWDMRRELGIEKLQPYRFDYDYTNIFRSNQDFDVVIDGNVGQAEALESAIQKHYNYFSGTRPTWEVRLLNEQRADKDSIMGDDFQNQHTDSHSTGLIEMMDCEGDNCVRDVRDINNPQNAFLMDMFEAKLHYYFSKNHKNTKRFKAGMNPEILSVIRYFTKAVQYELERRPEDVELIENMIKNFKPSMSHEWDSYVHTWLEKNAKKLIVNAVDMEFAQSLIEKTGLKKKLIALGDPASENTMAWWINKDALKSSPIGQGDGKTAGELFPKDVNGQIIVSHETNSFAAFESITKAHDGSANVLRSRDDIAGEAAVSGDGHYTKIGRTGGRGTGLTIRYILDPMAREGSDFSYSGNTVIINNKSALIVIYENLEIDILDYFKMLQDGLDFDFNDKGVVEKLMRRIRRKSQKISASKESKLYNIVKNSLDNKSIVREWFELPISAKYPDVFQQFVENIKSKNQSYIQLTKIANTVFKSSNISQFNNELIDLAHYIYKFDGELSGFIPILGAIIDINPEGLYSDDWFRFVDKISIEPKYQQYYVPNSIPRDILGKKNVWKQDKVRNKLIDFYLIESDYITAVSKYVMSDLSFAIEHNEKWIEIIEKGIENSVYTGRILENGLGNLLTHPLIVNQDEMWFRIIKSLVQKTNAVTIFKYLFNNQYIVNSEKTWKKIVDLYFEYRVLDDMIITDLAGSDKLDKQPEKWIPIIQKMIQREDSSSSGHIGHFLMLDKRVMANKEKWWELIELFVEKFKNIDSFDSNILIRVEAGLSDREWVRLMKLAIDKTDNPHKLVKSILADKSTLKYVKPWLRVAKYYREKNPDIDIFHQINRDSISNPEIKEFLYLTSCNRLY